VNKNLMNSGLAPVSERPRLLDLMCGAGGCTKGYQRAGFYVVGVDINPQPNYCGDEFVQGDWREFMEDNLLGVQKGWADFDGVHASPPCQGYANLGNDSHQRLIRPVRELLRTTGLPYVIENIADAGPYMENPIRLCGSTFGLHVRRHRLFETNFPVMVSPCQHEAQGEIRAYYGKPGWAAWTPGGAQVQKKGRKPLLRGSVEQAPDDMGIDWMTWDELREAIPPAYTEHIGSFLMKHLEYGKELAA
jgi:DNA (cytosine-5)-methyltransferase 1